MTGFLDTLFPVDTSLVGPEQAAQLQRNALLQFGLGTLASAQQPGGTLGGSLFGGFQAGQNALNQATQNAFQASIKKDRLEQQGRERDQEAQRIKIAQDEQQRKSREFGAGVAQRLSSGIASAKDNPLGYYNFVSRTPEFQAVAQQYGIDPASITTPEQVIALGQQLGAVGGVGAAVQAREPTEPLEAIIGPKGQPVLAPRSQASGKTPYYRPNNALAVTTPDGTTFSYGEPGAVGPNELTKPTVNKLQESIVGAQDRLDRLNATLATYKPEFLQAKGLLKAKTGELAEFLGGELDPERKKFLSEYSEFRATAANDFNQTLRDLSGAAVTDGEAKRALSAAPSPDDKSPTQFEAKAKATTKTIRRAILRANYALKNGIGTQSIEQLSKIIPLEAVDAIYEARVNEIFDELGGTDDKRREAIQRANQEFGIAR